MSHSDNESIAFISTTFYRRYENVSSSSVKLIIMLLNLCNMVRRDFASLYSDDVRWFKRSEIVFFGSTITANIPVKGRVASNESHDITLYLRRFLVFTRRAFTAGYVLPTVLWYLSAVGPCTTIKCVSTNNQPMDLFARTEQFFECWKLTLVRRKKDHSRPLVQRKVQTTMIREAFAQSTV